MVFVVTSARLKDHGKTSCWPEKRLLITALSMESSQSGCKSEGNVNSTPGGGSDRDTSSLWRMRLIIILTATPCGTWKYWPYQ